MLNSRRKFILLLLLFLMYRSLMNLTHMILMNKILSALAEAVKLFKF